MEKFTIQRPIGINEIATSLYQLPIKIQFCHHLTSSYAAHKALDEAYDKLNDLKDSIIEKLIGYSGNKFTNINMTNISGYTENMNMQVAKEIIDFSKKLEDFASKNNYSDIENLAQEYSGVGAQLIYLLNLK